VNAMQNIVLLAKRRISLIGLENRRGGNSTVGSNPTPSANINELRKNKARAWRAWRANESGSRGHKSRHSLLLARSIA